MKIFASSRPIFVLGFVLLAATNILVLSGAALNRWGEPESHITLSERELLLPYKIHEENSGLALRLAWRTLARAEKNNTSTSRRSPAWFGAEKLEELGIDTNDYSGSNGTMYKQPIPKEVFIVLENNGETYREAVRMAESAFEREKATYRLEPGNEKLLYNFESAEERLKRERTAESRLFAIDAGLDPVALRKKYNDRSRFIIARGLVKPAYNCTDKDNREIFGYISRLSISTINVPLKYRKILDSFLSGKSADSLGAYPGYQVKMAYGRRFEPWILSVE